MVDRGVSSKGCQTLVARQMYVNKVAAEAEQVNFS